jgi:hypothetical protein
VRSRRIELKKVLGEENPADLLTKHSLSKERLEKLTALYDYHFKGGRAETALLTRTAASDKKTIAEADTAVNSVDKHGTLPLCLSTEPCMPHNHLTPQQLEEQYPSLEAVEDLDLPDLSRLEDEQLYSAGMRVVQDILREMSEVGRTRKQGGTSEDKKPDKKTEDKKDGFKGTSAKDGFNRGGARERGGARGPQERGSLNLIPDELYAHGTENDLARLKLSVDRGGNPSYGSGSRRPLVADRTIGNGLLRSSVRGYDVTERTGL